MKNSDLFNASTMIELLFEEPSENKAAAGKTSC